MSDTSESTSRKSFEDIVYLWWTRLHEETQLAGDTYPVRRKDAAELRRATTKEQVLLLPAYHNLRLLLLQEDIDVDRSKQTEQLISLAMICPHIRHDDRESRSVGHAMGRISESERPAVSELRFLKLLRCESHDALTTQLRRTIPLTGKKLPVKKLIYDVLHWDARIRQQWAETYYDCTVLS